MDSFLQVKKPLILWLVYIIPRSWTSGAYFKRFREYFLTKGKLEHIHLFVSRNKVFDKENVLQETIIIKVRKTAENPETVTITSSKSNNDFGEITSLTVPYDLVVSGSDHYVYLVTDEEEEGAIPLFYSQHIKHGKVEFPIQKDHEYVVTEKKD